MKLIITENVIFIKLKYKVEEKIYFYLNLNKIFIGNINYIVFVLYFFKKI